MILYIKDMVCVRCIMLVKKIMDEMGIPYNKVELGQVELRYIITNDQKQQLKKALISWQLDLLDDNKQVLVEKIKCSVINLIHNEDEKPLLKTSHYLSSYLNYNYSYLANVFSQETGIWLSDYIISLKIEKAKELLVKEKLTISEIAWKLNYSSVAHLSNQFTKITGLRPSQFKKKMHKIFIPPGKLIPMDIAS
ncbi:hypothetical protein BH11BAC3_BH11BAC3_14170 [soil metagenome]